MSLFLKHKELIHRAVQAINERVFYAAYPEHPKAYPAESMDNSKAYFDGQLNNKFEELLQSGTPTWAGEEESPYWQKALGIKYPIYESDEVVASSKTAWKAWKKVSVGERAGILVEALEGIKSRFFDIAITTQHTTGQSWIMSFQASGPHSNDRALEALALGYQELSRYPSQTEWEKPMGKFSIKLDKSFTAISKGVSLVIGCSTFPVWNSVPGIFASLMTGNSTIVKPHSKAVLPIAIIVAEIQKVLKAQGLNPDICQLAADTSAHLNTKEIAENPSVKVIDYTGGSAFGDYIESLKGKTVFTEKAGVNSVILHSTEDLKTVFQNLSFSVALYSGQMCTAPQNFFIPETGIKSGDEMISYADAVEMLKKNIIGLVNHPKMGAGTLGAIQNPMTAERAMSVKEMNGTTIVEAGTIANPEFENARICTPTVIEVNSDNKEVYEKELFGPIVVVIKTKSIEESVELARDMAENHGAITCAAYTTDDAIKSMIEEEMNSVFTPVSFNLTGFIWVNQHAAFSDFHVTGGNPAGNASFTNPEYVNKRFVWVGNRTLMTV